VDGWLIAGDFTDHATNVRRQQILKELWLTLTGLATARLKKNLEHMLEFLSGSFLHFPRMQVSINQS